MEDKRPTCKSTEHYLHIQLQIAAILAGSVNLNMDAQKILAAICEHFSWKIGEIWAVDKHKNVIICVSQWLVSDRFKKIKELDYQATQQQGEGIAGLIWKEKSPYWSQNLKKSHPNWSTPMVDELGVNSCFGLPIRFNEEIHGILLFYSQSIPMPDHDFLELFTAISQQIATFIKRRRIEDELLFLSQHDRLTGLATRTILEKHIQAEINYAQTSHTKVVLLYLDLDNFKHVNDSLGHAVGDILLEKFSQRLTKLARETDTVARIGGDEFAILLSNMKSLDTILLVVEKIFQALQKPYFLAGKNHLVTLSIGISIYPNDCSTVAELIINADKAMYLAKKNGKNQFQFLSKNNAEINQLMDDLPQALERQEFIVYYQPIFTINSNQIVGHEAKLRWKHPQGRVLNAHEFLPTLLENNLVTEVQKWFIEAICRQLLEWRKHQFDAGTVYLPVLQLTENLISMLTQCFHQAKLKLNTLAVEIKETMLLETPIMGFSMDNLQAI